MDFVVDRTAEGRVVKCLTIVDDAKEKALAIGVERAISGKTCPRYWIDWQCSGACDEWSGQTKGREFYGKAMMVCARENGVALRLISAEL